MGVFAVNMSLMRRVIPKSLRSQIRSWLDKESTLQNRKILWGYFDNKVRLIIKTLYQEIVVEEQLQMRRPHLENLPPVIVPQGYDFRTFREGDEQAWGQIMNSSFNSVRTAEIVRQELTQMSQFTPDGLFFATYNGTPVGSACAWRERPDEWRHGVVYMVCVLPEHRGHKLGYFLTLAVLHWFKEHNFEDVSLSTDDWRLPAVKEYLQLGFAPIITDHEVRQRWLGVLQALKLERLAEGLAANEVNRAGITPTNPRQT